ncbi:hypothetical protein PoB_004902400 [Plakobranchus ocellatus]|uniref:Uncharacterized protein n=1 Tax=Plakobranchus ocellatus TaxID=259542 RepID=A0AAV4BQT2_9GAST|nr:hypothetical protein PoB_004902400 [Plakobranchus ocellatus]
MPRAQGFVANGDPLLVTDSRSPLSNLLSFLSKSVVQSLRSHKQFGVRGWQACKRPLMASRRDCATRSARPSTKPDSFGD